MKYIIIKSAFDDKTIALKTINYLIENKLISCAQMNDIESIYTWKRKVESAKEIMVTMKTKECLYEKVEEVIKSFHNYETPQIIAIPIIKGSKEFLDWINEVTI